VQIIEECRLREMTAADRTASMQVPGRQSS
jgi:hypothetical protein